MVRTSGRITIMVSKQGQLGSPWTQILEAGQGQLRSTT
jgi:hypothetical protein